MNRQDFRSFTRIEVRWAEVDAQKIVFNAHYLMYADVAITNYWRQLAIPYEAGFASLGGELFVKRPARSITARPLWAMCWMSASAVSNRAIPRCSSRQASSGAWSCSTP
jgi:hypothetical protein